MAPGIQKLKNAIRGTEFEHDLWLVGGCVRDELLGLPAKSDFDLVTTRPLADLMPLVRAISEHAPVIYERFGTAMAHIDGCQLEFVTARRESYDPESRKPVVERGTILDDAMRRDFTANALFKSLTAGELLDPTGQGLDDLKRKILRTPKEPATTFSEDPLRMLRAVRFRWQLGFQPAPVLYEAIAESAFRLEVISAERYRDEFNKILLLPSAAEALAEMMTLGLFKVFIPEFEAMVGVDQGSFHHLDVWNHTLLVLKNLESTAGLLLRLAALFHDIAKPQTRTLSPEGVVHFYDHQVVGEAKSRGILGRLKYSNDEAATVAKLVRNHMRLGGPGPFTASAARRLIRDLGDDLENLFELVEADAGALKPGVRVLALEPIRAQVEAVAQQTPKEALNSPLDGADIATVLGIEPGPEVGKAKSYLIERVLEGDLDPNDKEQAKKLLQEFIRKPNE